MGSAVLPLDVGFWASAGAANTRHRPSVACVNDRRDNAPSLLGITATAKERNYGRTQLTNCSNIQRITPCAGRPPSPPPGCIRHPHIHPLLVEIRGGMDLQDLT